MAAKIQALSGDARLKTGLMGTYSPLVVSQEWLVGGRPRGLVNGGEFASLMSLSAFLTTSDHEAPELFVSDLVTGRDGGEAV